MKATMLGKAQLRSQILILITIALMALASLPSTRAANIVWVSDANDPAVGFFPAGSGYTDSGFVTLLQNAGHNVIRYNQPNGQATLLTPAEITALNTNDLIIISRAVNSGAFQPTQGEQWNTNIIKPLIDMSPYHIRTSASRMGWVAGDVSDNFDDTPTPLRAVLTGDPVRDAAIDYLFAGVPMEGTNTALAYDEAQDRNTSQIAGAPVAGGIIYANVNYVQQNSDTGARNNGNAIIGFPAGTPVRSGTNILAGYRMFFAAGTRESATAPNGVTTYAGRENLSPVGENVFLRAVQLAINNGVPPATDLLAPVGFTSQPVSLTVLEGSSATFSVTVTGAAPRTVTWQRDPGDGTFVDIPGASTPFSISSYTLPSVTQADNGTRYKAVATNAFGTAESDIVTLTVRSPDPVPPTATAASLDGLSIGVCFSQVMNTNDTSFTDPFLYKVNGGAGPDIVSIMARADGKSLVIDLSGPLGPTFTLEITGQMDRYGNLMEDATITGVNLGLTPVVVGALNPAGTNFACSGSSFEISGGGLDVAGTADMLRFAYKTVTGDFDARVRVSSLIGTPDHLESTAKALLAARESTATGAGAVTVYSTPSLPAGAADNAIVSIVRTNAGGPTGTLGTATPNGLPNAWLRIQRVGNVFTTFRSVNGTDWNSMGSITLNYGPSMVVGPGVVSHRNGRLVTGTFSDLQILALPKLANPAYNGGSFSAQLQTQSGVNYTIQYKDALQPGSWSVLSPGISGDGTVKTFTDPGPVSPTGNRFYRVSVP